MKRQLLIVPKRRECATLQWGGTREAPRLFRGKRNSGKMWADVFIVASVGRSR